MDVPIIIMLNEFNQYRSFLQTCKTRFALSGCGCRNNRLVLTGVFSARLTCSWVQGMSLCLESSLMTLRSVRRSNLQPTSTTLAPGQNSCVSPCHCVSTDRNTKTEWGRWRNKLISSHQTKRLHRKLQYVDEWMYALAMRGSYSLYIMLCFNA